MNHFKHFFFFIASILLFNSCRDLVDTDIADFGQVPVLNSIIIDGAPIEAHVSIASSLDTMQLEGIGNATVELYEDSVFVEPMQYSGDGWFSSNHLAEAGKSYSLHLSIEGIGTVKANCTIPEPLGLLSFEHIPIAGKDDEGLTYPAISFTFENNPDEERYFEVCIRLFEENNYEGNNYERNAYLGIITDPVLLNEGLPLMLFSNELMNDTEYTMTINYGTGSASSSSPGVWITNLYPLILELRSVSKEYYVFARQKYLYDTGRFPEFGLNAQTAFPLYSNVEGGYGIVASYSKVATDTIYPTY
ncbi:MAG: DUF4249 domain-containing protein [Bacteroidales bacterium]|nr:DUF4249 domain-containing protein [Bacteroidales bacterium]